MKSRRQLKPSNTRELDARPGRPSRSAPADSGAADRSRTTATITRATQAAGDGIARRKRRWGRLLTPQAQPGFCFVVNHNDPKIQLPPPPPIWPDRRAERIERKLQDYERALDRAAWLDDDSVPYLDMVTGSEIFAEALGSPVHRPDDSNPFALPAIHSAREVAAINVPNLGDSTLAYLFEMADELKRRAGSEALLRLVDIQSPMDIAALVLEKSAFFTGMIETPEAVKELAAKVLLLQTAFLDEWFRRYGVDYIAHFPAYFMSGGITLSEDEVGAVNAEMFEEFFLPELVALAARYGGIGIHCCADARHQWAHFRGIAGLRLLNFCLPPTRQPAEYICPALDFFRDTCAQWHMGWGPTGPVETWLSQYPAGSRVVIEANTESRDEAIRLCAQLQETRRRLFPEA